jgi:hypothetical protein
MAVEWVREIVGRSGTAAVSRPFSAQKCCVPDTFHVMINISQVIHMPQTNTRTPSDLERYTGLTPAKLTNLAQNGIVSPTVNPGKKGRGVHREYTMAETLSVMIAAHFRDRLGITTSRQLAPLVRAICSIKSLDHTLSDVLSGHADGTDYPEYVVFNGTESYTCDELPTEPACLIVNLAEFVNRLRLLDEYVKKFDPGLRLEALWLIGSEDDGPAERSARRLANEIVHGDIPKERAARMLDIPLELLDKCIRDVKSKSEGVER